MLKALISGRKKTQKNLDDYSFDFLSYQRKQKIVNFAHMFVLGVFVLQSSFFGVLLPVQQVVAVDDVVIDECSEQLGDGYETVSLWQRNLFSWSEVMSDPSFDINVTGDDSTANWTANPLIASVLRVTDEYTEFPGGSSGSVLKCDYGGNSRYCGKDIAYIVFCNGPICGNGELNEGEQCDDGNDIDNDGCSSTCENEQATLIVRKIVDEGAASPDAFTMEIRDNQDNILETFPGSETGYATTVLSGTYQITETGGPLDYDLDYSMDCDDGGYLTLASGETKTCVLTNTYNPVPGSLLVKKLVVGGTATSSDWTMNISDITSFAGSASGTVTELEAGNMYQVTESDGPSDYVLTYDENSDCGASGLVTINPDEQSTCTLINTHIPECGDTLVEGDEECDWGDQYDTDCDADYGEVCGWCDQSCNWHEKTPECGDGIWQSEHEQCEGDQGVNGPNEVCTPECTISYLCGNGVINDAVGETCDAGDQNGINCGPVAYNPYTAGQCNWCSDTCQTVIEYGPYCGDAILQDDEGEQCDDGNEVDDDACSNDCQLNPGILTVQKIVDNSAGGFALAESFTMYIRDALNDLLYSFAGSSTGTSNSVDEGTYYVTESSMDNYNLTYSGDCDKVTGEVVLLPGESKTCTLTNTFSPPAVQTGELTVKKVVIGGYATSSDWTMGVSGPGVGAFFLGSETGDIRSYPVGEYTVSESTSTPVDGEYTLTYSGDCDASGTVAVVDDTPKTCILTNTHVPECGDGVLEGDEECDDGNLIDGDSCSSVCALETSISGCKYSDENNNGIIDEGEAKLGNWGIELWGCGSLAPMPSHSFSLFPSSRFVENNEPGITGNCVLRATTTTDSSGCYEFDGLYGGDYGVKEAQDSDWTQTYPADQTSYYINVPRGTATTSIHFANNLNPICGDNELNQETEECDGTDGVTSGYHCTSDCTLERDTPSARCGDGIKNQSSEECDGNDGVPSGYSCTNSCTLKQNGGSGGGKPPYYVTGGGSFLSTPVVKGEEGEPTLEVVKEIDRTQANPGDLNILYTVRVKNSGNLTAFNVVVEDTLPEGLKFVDHEENVRAWSLENIAASEEKLIVYGIDVLASTTAGDYINTVLVKADNHDTIQTSATLEVIEIQVLAATGISYLELGYLVLMTFLFVQTSRTVRKKLQA